MRKKAVKAAVIMIEAAALVIAIAAAAIVFLYWRTGQGPVSLGPFGSSIEGAIERRLPQGYDAEIRSIDVRRTENSGLLLLRLTELKILDADGVAAAEAPEILFSFYLQDLMKGAAGPKTAVADGAQFRIVRKKNLNIELPISPVKQQRPSFPFVSSLFEGNLLSSAFESAEISNAKIVFYDEASQRSWSTGNAQVSLKRSGEGLVAHASSILNMDGERAGLEADAVYREDNNIVDVTVKGEQFPVGDLLSMFYGDRAAILDAPVSGEAVISFTPEGKVLSSNFDAKIGAGSLAIGGVRRNVSTIAWVTSFDPMRNRFSIDHLAFDVEGARGMVAGGVSISFGDDIRKPERISFDLEADEITISAPEWLEDTLVFEANRLVGAYRLADRRLRVSSLETTFEGLAADGFITFDFPRAKAERSAPSPGVIADLSIQGALDARRLLNIWPKKRVASGARDWVKDRLAAAHIDNLKFKMDLAPGGVAEDGAFPDDALELTFDARDVTAHYVKGMTPLRGGVGSGVLRGNSFKLDVKRAQVGGVAITDGEVSFPEFMPKWRPTYYRFTASGDAEAMLSILDEKPLSLLSKVNLSPAQFSGEATAQVEIMRPNKRDVSSEEYGYSGVATFEKMKISELLGEIQFTDAKGKVDLKTRSMTVTADAKLADAPIELKWSQQFYREDGPSEMEIAGMFDSTAGDLFGVSTRQFVRGPVYFEGRAVGELGAFESLDLNTDFGDASMSFDMLGWRKPAGVPASGALKMRFADERVFVDALTIEAQDNAHIDGALVFDQAGALQSATINEFSLADAAELMISAERDASGVLGFTVVGPFLNAGPVIEQMLTDTGGGDRDESLWGAGVALNARIDRIALRNGVLYDDGALDLRRDAQSLQALDFTAFDEKGTPLKVTMSLTGAEEGPQRVIEAETGALGGLLSGVFGVRSVKGGDGVLRLMLNADGAKGYAGELEARNLQVVNAPLLARILSAGSLDGLANLLSGEGIEFDAAAGAFEYAGGTLVIDDLQATGSSVGITADGAVSFGPDGEARLNGAVAPIYLLNSALGNAPIIGDILVGKKGEGVVAFSYTVGGNIANPTVVVNPLSALTPGIFRRLMQPQAEPDAGSHGATTETQEPAPIAE